MPNYVALFCRGTHNLVYGACSPQTPEEGSRLFQFCKDYDIDFVTGSIDTVDELIRAYSIAYQLPGMPVDPKT